MAHFDISDREALDAAHQLDGFGVELPPDATKWLQRLQDLRTNKPQEARHNAVAELIADNAKPADIDKAIAYRLGQDLRVGQHMMAQQIVGRRVLDSILAERSRIHGELAVTADELIDRLHQAAVIDESVTDLTRARRTDEAHMVACAESDAAELNTLYALRNQFLTPEPRWLTGWWSCENWSNPWDIGHVADHDGTVWGKWRATIRAGGRLWFATLEEATTASSEHEPGDMLPPMNPLKGANGTFVG